MPTERPIRMDAELWLRDWAVTYEGFPDDYLVVDIETTGGEEKDLIIQLGWCNVVGRKIVDNSGIVLNWTHSPLVDPRWVKRRMNWTAKQMYDKGANYPWSFDDLHEGSNPIHALSGFLELLADVRAKDGLLVAHNGVLFDMPMLANHFKRFLKIYYKFGAEEIWDTGALEKGLQLDELLCPGELPGDFAFRVIECPNNRNVSWNLHNHVVPKYDFVNRFGISYTHAHTAPFDAYVTHLLFEEYRVLAQRGLERQPVI